MVTNELKTNSTRSLMVKETLSLNGYRNEGNQMRKSSKFHNNDLEANTNKTESGQSYFTPEQ